MFIDTSLSLAPFFFFFYILLGTLERERGKEKEKKKKKGEGGERWSGGFRINSCNYLSNLEKKKEDFP